MKTLFNDAQKAKSAALSGALRMVWPGAGVDEMSYKTEKEVTFEYVKLNDDGSIDIATSIIKPDGEEVPFRPKTFYPGDKAIIGVFEEE